MASTSSGSISSTKPGRVGRIRQMNVARFSIVVTSLFLLFSSMLFNQCYQLCVLKELCPSQRGRLKLAIFDAQIVRHGEQQLCQLDIVALNCHVQGSELPIATLDIYQFWLLDKHLRNALFPSQFPG